MSGRPIVAVASGGLRNLFAAGPVGVEIDEPADAEAIGAAVRNFMSRPMAARYAEAVGVAERLRREWSWQAVAAQFQRTLVGPS